MDTTTPAAPTKTTSSGPKRTTYKGAEIMVEYLIKEKVPYLFGVCGHGNIGFLDAACSAADRIRTISVHHEQAAGYMADAYYKVKHQPVATYTSCGPGSCNMPVALAGAMMDSSAFLAITGNVPTTQFNRMPFQETGRFYQGETKNLKETFALIAEELRHQYRLGFYPDELKRDGSVHALSVKVNLPDVSVRSRREYLAK